MSDHRYQLDPRKPHRKYRCPNCGLRSLTPYIDMENGTMLAEDVGRCDHEVKCCYHKTPGEYFEEQGKSHSGWQYKPKSNPNWQREMRHLENTTSFIDRNIMERSIGHYDANPLFRWFSAIVGNEEAERLFRMYNVGTSRKWGGSAVFWQVDSDGNIRTGKVMGYDEHTGKRIKEPINLVSWAHTELGLSGFNLRQCLFGEHLLMCNPTREVAIVESEKTAIIAKSFIPDFVWLATGGKNGCFNRQAMEVLRDRDVIFIPDLKCEDDWRQRADRELSGIAKSYAVSDAISSRATEQQRSQGLDIADFMLMEPTPQMIFQSMIARNPYIKELMEKLDCALVDE